MSFFLFLIPCLNLQSSTYPEHWWRPVDPRTAPNWEVLPQDAGPEEVVLSKRNELGILSNFAHTPFKLDGVTYQSVEGFWQMMKFPVNKNDPRLDPRVKWKYSRKQVANMVGFQAKKAGSHANSNLKELGIKWITYKNKRIWPYVFWKGSHYRLIKRALWAKVTQNPRVKKVLMKTGYLFLIPDHHIDPKAPPPWNYHRIWMDIREDLRIYR
ncbi:MAG: NADAR family protein [Bacteriovoracia bacterium]